MVMPLRHEGSLTDWLQERSNAEKLSLQDIAHFIGQAADALHHAHDHQLIHQDVKPSNFLIRNKRDDPQHPDLLLADFGIAKFTTATATASQSIRGTPAFMAPEQWDGQPIAASDQYALAVMAYQLLTGRPPFLGGPGQVMRQHFTAQPQPPSTLNPRIPPALDAVILRALAKTASERFSSVTEFSLAFQQAIQSTSTATIERTPKASTSGESRTPSQATPANTGPRTPLPPDTSDLRATLAISVEEAMTGTTRTLTLPGGRKVTVQVPAGIPNGSTLRLADQGESTEGGPRGALIVTIMVKRAEEERPQPRKLEERTYLSDPGRGFPPSTVPVTPPLSSSFISMPPRTSTSSPVSRPPTHRGQPIQSRKRFSWARALLVIGLVALVVAASAVFFAQQNSPLPSSPYGGKLVPSSPYGGTLALSDPLRDNSQGYKWEETDDLIGDSCAFTNGTYHVHVQQQENFYCTSTGTSFRNFAYQINVTIIQGNRAGIIFRADNFNYYSFYMGTNGSYSVDVSSFPAKTNVLISGSTDAIHKGLRTANILAVVAKGNNITLYINNQQITSVTNDTYSQGQIGVRTHPPDRSV